MFWFFKKGVKIVLIGVAIYGLGHVPVGQKPLWKQLKQKGIIVGDMSLKAVTKTTKRLIEQTSRVILRAFKQEKLTRRQQLLKDRVKRTQVKMRGSSQPFGLRDDLRFPQVKETYTASEEQKLEKIIEDQGR